MPVSRYTTARKAHARADTLIDYYSSIFGPRLPAHQQYWSMCATCAEDGVVLPDSELDQAMCAGLIQPHQFHGVDRDEEVYASNRTYPHANWYCNDFYDAVSEAADTDGFHPGIVNVDTVSEPVRGVDLFCRVLERLREYRNVLFVGNFIIRNRNRSYTVEDVVEQINRHPRFREVAQTLSWDEERAFYRYAGSTRYGLTHMCSAVMWRK